MTGVEYIIQADRSTQPPVALFTGLVVSKNTYLSVEIRDKFLLHSVVMSVEYRADFPQVDGPLGGNVGFLKASLPL